MRHPVRTPAVRRRAPAPAPRGQRGMILIVVLVVLMMTLLAGMGVMQSVQTGNALAGNFSFRQVATQASDRAVTDALNQVANSVIGGAGNTGQANLYFPIAGAVGAMGIPTAVNWANVGCRDEKGVVLTDCTADTGNYKVQYVIERRCSSNPDLWDINSIRARCEFEPTATAAPETIALRYRVLIRVRGPRNTETFFEAVLSGPATK